MSNKTSTGKGNSAGLSLKVRQALFKMNPREKALLLLFAVALLAVWMSNLLDRIALNEETARLAADEVYKQTRWLGEAPVIEADYQRYISKINLTQLPPREEVNSQIDALVRSHNIGRFNLTEPRTQEGQKLKFHTFSLTLQQTDYKSVMDFTNALKTKLPYLSLQRITIRARPNDDRLLDVSYVLKSIEQT